MSSTPFDRKQGATNLDYRIENAVDTQHEIEVEPSVSPARCRQWRVIEHHVTFHGLPYALERIVWATTQPNIPNTLTQEVK